MQSFSEQLRSDARQIWETIFSNPFIAELESGSLPLEKFRYYLIQDYHYLEGFGRTVSIALSKAPDTETLRKLSLRISTPVERPLHGKLFKLLEIGETEAAKVGPAPTNYAYVNHMLATASAGSAGPSGVRELGERVLLWAFREEHGAWRELVDRFGAEGGPAIRDAMRRASLLSSRYEYLFWTMAYNLEEWPV